MREYTLRFREKDKNIFESIKSGKKTVETRAATKRYHNIQTGDTIQFVCGKEKCKRTAGRVRTFSTIKELITTYPVQAINPFVNSKEDLIKMYDSFPEYREKIKKFGIIAIELL